jgi:DNA polymerase III epsilon subunit-like protein
MLKKLRIFDFDDTLVTTHSFIKIKKQDGNVVSLTPAQYAQYDKEENDIFDFSDFTSLNNPQIIKWTFKILKNAIAKGGKVIVLTARSSAAHKAINDFFESKNIFDLEIITLGNGDPKAKSDAVSDMIEKDGYDFVEFFDDSVRNVDLMKNSIKKNYPDVQVRVHHIKSALMHEAAVRKALLHERVKPGSFYPPVFDDFLKLVSEYQDHVWVFFDTETTGLQYENKEVQATQVSCIAYYPNNFETAPAPVGGGEFDIKLALSKATRDYMETEPEDKFSIKNLLLMTDYADDSVKKVNPGYAIYKFEEYLHKMRSASSSGKLVLIAQNSPFDVGILNNLYRRLDVEPPDDEVWDTKAAIDLYFKPVLSLMKKNPDATDEDKDLLSKLVVNGRISGSLGKITSAFNIENKGWHQAIQDVRMTMEMLFRIIQYLRAKSPEIRNTVASKPFDAMAGDPVYGVFSKKNKQKTESVLHALINEIILEG